MIAGSGGGPSVRSLNCKYNIAAVLGYPENVDEDLSAVYTANPTQVAFFTVMVDHPNHSGAYDVSFIIEMKFYTLVYDLISPG